MTGWNRLLPWFGIGALVAAGLWFALRVLDLNGATTPRAYAVQPEIAVEMRSALERALSNAPEKGPSLARITLLPDGRHLMVTARPAVQKGVASVMAQVADYKPVPTPTITFEAWMVVATPGSGTKDAALAEIEPALASIQKAKGPLRFRLLEKLTTSARAGKEDGQVMGARSFMRVDPALLTGKDDAAVVTAEVEISIHTDLKSLVNPMMLKAVVELPPGELLVVGQSGMSGTDAGDAQLYYIVRAAR